MKMTKVLLVRVEEVEDMEYTARMHTRRTMTLTMAQNIDQRCVYIEYLLVQIFCTEMDT